MIASANETDFDDWILSAFAEAGPFTILFVLLRVEGIRIDLLRSAYLHVVGDELRWPDMVHLFGGAGVDWSGVVFFRAGREGLWTIRRPRPGFPPWSASFTKIDC